MREDFRIAVAAVVDEHHHRLGPLAVEVAHHHPLAAVALHELRVVLAHEVVQHLVVGEAASVVAHVDDKTFLVEVVRVQGTHEHFEARFVHAGDVDIAEFATALLGDVFRIAGHPPVVQQRAELVARHRLDLDVAACLPALDLEGNAFPGPVVEQLGEVHTWCQFRAVEMRDDVAGLQVQPAFVGRSALQHFGNLQARPGVAVVEQQAEFGGLGIGCRTSPTDAQV